MAYRLPSLNALRAFEAAARHLSFTRAADELCVTQGAISRHIGILEDALGKKLFLRLPRRMELTPAAETYLVSVREAFDIIHAATRNVSVVDEAEPLRILALPTFATRWLVPRLHLFTEANPDIMIRLETTAESSTVDREGVDIAIEAAASDVPNVVSEKLLDVDLVPICHPTSVSGMPPPTDPAEVPKYALLYTLMRVDFWSHWAEALGIRGLDGAAKFYFQNSSLVYQAAKEGLGLGMGIRCFLEDELDAGTLITPFEGSVLYPAAYFMNVPLAKLRQTKVTRFQKWLSAQAQAPTRPRGCL